MVEVIRSCPLRSCFEISSGYERRMSFDGRIGTAFHKVLEDLSQRDLSRFTPNELAEVTRIHFDQQIKHQRDLAETQPRERRLPRNIDRIERSIAALISASHRLTRAHLKPDVNFSYTKEVDSTISSLDHSLDQVQLSEVEVRVATTDGHFIGQIDRVEPTELGTRLVDYKSALRDDLPDRYIRQLQLYALMWNATRHEWPVEAIIIYPLTGRSYTVNIDPAACERVGQESYALVEHVASADPYDLGSPGDVCKICEFRPWCKPFWNAQASIRSQATALEQARLGLEGTITSLEKANDYWKVAITWRGITVDVVAPIDRFPQLRNAQVGTHVRLLDIQLRGMRHRPRAMINEWSELFLVL